MPLSFDIYQYTANFNPIAGGSFVSVQDVMASFGDVFQEIIALFPELAQVLESISPDQILQIVESGLTTFLPQFLEQIFPTDGSTSSLMTAVTNALIGTAANSGIVPQLITIAVTLLPQLGTNIESVLASPGNLLSGFTTGGLTLLQQLITAGGGNAGAANPLTEFASLLGGLPEVANALFNTTGSTDSTLGVGGANLLALLGNPSGLLSTGFDPVGAGTSMLQQVLTPAGALTTFTQIPAHLLGTLSGSNTGNVLPDPNFADPNRFDGEQVWTVSSINRAGVGGSAQVVADGVLHSLIGVPYPTKPGQQTAFSAYVFWTGATAGTGNAFVLAANAYDANDNLISDPSRVLAAIANPAAQAGDGNYLTTASWQQLTGDYTAPANTAYVRICLEVEATVTVGIINFTGTVHAPSGLIDASLLGNIENIPQLLGTSVGGAQGIVDVTSTFDHIVDGLGSAFGSQTSGLSFPQLFALAQSTSQDASSAATTAQNVASTQAIVNNRPPAAGLEATVESNTSLQSLGSASAPTYVTVTQSASAGAWVRLSQAKTLGFVQWIGEAVGTVTGFYLNFAKMDASGNWVALFSSADIHAALNTAWGWQIYDIPTADLIDVNPGDVIGVEFQLIGSGSYNIASVTQSWLTTHPSAPTVKPGFSRNTGATGPTPLSVAAGAAGFWNGTTTYIGTGVGTANIPAPLQAPVTVTHTVNGNYTDTAPSWWRPGVDYLDRIALGPGGGGDSGYGGPGAAGNNTTITVAGDTLVGAAAPGANSGGSYSSSDYVGHAPTPNPFVYNGVPYYGGSDVSYETNGSPPGGGGGGGSWYSGATGLGAQGGSWAADTMQPATTTVTSTVGKGGVGQSTFAAGSGADGMAVLVWRQAT
jgi:hypothetical protein